MLQGWEACWMRARDRAAAARGGEGGRVGAMVVLTVWPAVATARRRERRRAETDVALRATTEAAAMAAVAEVTRYRGVRQGRRRRRRRRRRRGCG